MQKVLSNLYIMWKIRYAIKQQDSTSIGARATLSPLLFIMALNFGLATADLAKNYQIIVKTTENDSK